MIYQRGHLARPLDAILSSGSRLAVLRTLLKTGEPGMSGRKIARLAGINHQSAALALDALAAIGVVRRTPAKMKTFWTLDRRRWLVSEVLLPMLDREDRHAESLAGAIKTALKGKCRAVLLVGEAARGRQAPGKPLGLVAVQDGPKRGLSDALRALKLELHERWAVELDARILTANEAMRVAALEDAWRLLPDEGSGFIAAASR